MEKHYGPEESSILVSFVLWLRGWQERQLAAATGLEEQDVKSYKEGTVIPPVQILERLSAAAGLPLYQVEPLLPVLLRLRDQAEGRLPVWSRRAQGSLEELLQALNLRLRPIIEKAYVNLGLSDEPETDEEELPLLEETW